MISLLNDSEIRAEPQFVESGFTTEEIYYLVNLILLSSIFAFGTIVNFIVFIIFYRRPSLRSISNRFVLSLTSANILSAMIVAPAQGLRIGRQFLSMVRCPKGECLYIDPVFGVQLDWFCQSCRILTTIATEASILSVLVIAIDRYCAVTSPLHYSMTITRGRSIRLIIIVWSVSIMYSIPLVVAKFTSNRKNLPTICWPEQPSALVHRFGLYYSATLGFCGFAIPFLVLVWIYIKMYRAALKNSERTRRHSISAHPSEIFLPESPPIPETANHNSVKAKTRVQRKRSSNSSISSLFFREGKAIKTGIIVISSFITSWMPYYIYKVFETFYCYYPNLQNCVILLALSSSCTMPFIYVYRNETAKKEALKVICWWKPNVPTTPTFQRASHQHGMNNGHSSTPVRIVKPEADTLYSYTTLCKECDSSQLVSSLKTYHPLSTPIHEPRLQNTTARRENTVGYTVNSPERLSTRCKVCSRQDTASSGSCDDPLLGDRFRYARNSSCSTRWTRHRSSNGSVTTRSDSLASTNSSIFSYGVHRWPRRCSTFSTDSGGTNSRRSGIEDIPETPSISVTPRSYRIRALKVPSFECEDEPRDMCEISDFHLYANPFRNPHVSVRDGSLSSTSRFIWEIEEADSYDEDTFVIEKGLKGYNSGYSSVIQQPREMEDILKLKDIRRAEMFKKRYSQQELRVDQNNRSYCGPVLNRQQLMTVDKFKNIKLLKDEENRSLKIREKGKFNEKYQSSDRHSLSSSIACCDASSMKKPTDL